MRMNKDDHRLILSRIDDLIVAGNKRLTHSHTEFLDMAEGSAVMDYLDRLSKSHCLTGGYPEAERKIAVIKSDDSNMDFPGELPLSYIRITPDLNRFVRMPEHRHYLGALINLGIERRVLGDIIMQKNGCILICMSHISEYILTRLTKVGPCHVSLSLMEQLSDVDTKRQYKCLRNTVASLRLDSVLKAAVNLSRGDSMSLIKSGRVFVNSREVTKASSTVEEGQIISVRGHGKFRIKTIGDRTKKDRIVIEIDQYI